jgi:hypothetical protein
MKDNIYVQDNFFDSKFIQTLQKELVTLDFKYRYNDENYFSDGDPTSQSVYNRNYHHVELTQDAPVVQELAKQLKTHFNFSSIKYMESFYFLSFPNTPAIPHQDHADFNCLIYLLGNPLMNNGTGFYIDQGGEKILNSHVGFKENRALFFDSKIYHSPLQFAGNSSPRYVMANFIEKG